MDTWKDWIGEESGKEYFKRISKTIQIERSKYRIFPKFESTFRAFSLCPLDRIKVVIIGQDPYPQPGIADGLAFSTQKPGYIPETLRIVFNDIARSVYPMKDREGLFETSSLEWWAKQGVLLLNFSLTVRAFHSNSHKEIWKPFITKAIGVAASVNRPIVWMLWGNEAKTLKPHLDTGMFGGDKLILESPHPVAESRGSAVFSGRETFVHCNNFLDAHYGKGQGIDWRTYNTDPFPVEWQEFQPTN